MNANTNSPQQPQPQQPTVIRPDTPFAVPAMLVNLILQYLDKQPHGQVRDMVNALERCQPLMQPTNPEKPDA